MKWRRNSDQNLDREGGPREFGRKFQGRFTFKFELVFSC
jgi:hypothetical protein